MGESQFLDAAGRVALAEALGETPETVMSVHRLRRGLARAVVDGGQERPLPSTLPAALPHNRPGTPAVLHAPSPTSPADAFAA